MALDKSDFIPGMVPGFITFCVGLGIVLNGLLFTVPRKKLFGGSADTVSPRILEANIQYDANQYRAMTNELTQQRVPASSVTEHTTHHLNSKKS